MGAFYIYKTNSMVTAFTVTPTLTNINYSFPQGTDTTKLAVGDHVLIYKSESIFAINSDFVITDISTSANRTTLNKEFETKIGCGIDCIPNRINKLLNAAGDNTVIGISESEYNNIVTTIFNRSMGMICGNSSCVEPTIALDSTISYTQKIYYGAPGTGKSHIIKNDILRGVDDDCIFRTTFHPDTDHTSFVGCYKPIMQGSRTKRTDYTIDDLASMLKDYYAAASSKVTALHSFVLKYVEYLNGDIASFSKKDLVVKAGLTEDYKVEVNKIVNLNKWMIDNKYLSESSNISYAFSPQIFTNAYVEAWNNPGKTIYLIIEEINRGNCAQIFGDIFQLLDRKNGVSEYPIKAETELCDYLCKKLKGNDGIKDGKLKLPANLSILATMNTSDQSLFPMDSAFKRRWDWGYMPIDTSKVKDMQIDINGSHYSWSEFLETVNKHIYEVNTSEDKQLGQYFIKADETTNTFTFEQFRSKVMFYLWFEIYKDEDRNSIFKVNNGTEENKDMQPFTFGDLFKSNGVDLLNQFMVNSIKLEVFNLKVDEGDVQENAGE